MVLQYKIVEDTNETFVNNAVQHENSKKIISNGNKERLFCFFQPILEPGNVDRIKFPKTLSVASLILDILRSINFH